MAKTSIICIVIAIIVLGGLATLIAWLADRMKSPSFDIDIAAITGYNLTTENRLNATFSLTILTHNRDSKYNLKYQAIVLSVYHKGYTLAYQSLAPFNLGHGDEVTLNARPTANNVVITDDVVAMDLRGEAKRGELTLEVRIRAAVRFEAKHWKHRSYTLKVICSGLVLGLTPGKRFQPINCDVDRF